MNILSRKRKLSRFTRIVIAIFTQCPTSALAGAWTLEQGRSQIIFTATAMAAPMRFDHGGRALRADRFSKQETNVLVEHGLRDGLTLIAGGALRASALTTSSSTSFSVGGTLSAGARVRLWTDGMSVVALQGLTTGGGERSLPRGGRMLDAPVEAEARLLYGRSFDIIGRPAFAEAQLAYRWRGGGKPDEIMLDATLGFRPTPRLLVLLQSFNAAAVGKNRSFAGGRMRRHKVQPSIVWDMTDLWSLQLGAFVVPAGRETPLERGALLAVWRRF